MPGVPRRHRVVPAAAVMSECVGHGTWPLAARASRRANGARMRPFDAAPPCAFASRSSATQPEHRNRTRGRAALHSPCAASILNSVGIVRQTSIYSLLTQPSNPFASSFRMHCRLRI
ncbi:hypothetical protein [Burkholderia oklahomensis]|uniref:hypothetical protein n=1 Tax=Burkholderia oklahomensis TaxID=342113 RepID=UPI001E41C845|nr:hypothetical protein [Burkholderia oklahomensis]